MHWYSKHSLAECSHTSHTHTHNTIFLCSAPLIMSSPQLMIFTFYTQQRGMPFCRQSLTVYNTRQKHRLCCALSFFFFCSHNRKAVKGKMGQQQLNSQIPGFVKAEEVCSWGSRGGRGGCSSVKQQRLPSLFCIYYYFLHLSSLKKQIKTG